MSKIVETQTELVCVNDNPTTNPQATVVAAYNANHCRSVANTYGVIRGLTYASTPSGNLETINGIPTAMNIRVFNTMLVPLIVQVLCYPYDPAVQVTMNLSVAPGGSVTVPSAWKQQSVKLGQAADVGMATIAIAPYAVPTNAAIFWWS